MKFFEKLFNKHKNEVSVTEPKDVLLTALLGGETITRDKAMSLPSVADDVDLISSIIASIPIKLYKRTGDKKEEIKEDYRIPLLNKETEDLLNSFHWKKSLIIDYLLGKGGFSYIQKKRNVITGLYYIPERHVTPYSNNEIIKKRCEYLVGNKFIPDYEMFRILRETEDGITSKGLIERVGKAIETAYFTMLYELNLVKKGGNKKGFLEAKKKLSEEALRKLRDGWNKMYTSNEENCIILNDGVQFRESSNTSVEMQLNESKLTLDKEIDSIFHIKDNFEDTFKEAIFPIIKEFETELDKFLLLESEKKKGFFFNFDITEITKANIEKRYAAHQTAISSGWKTINEVRFEEDMNEIPGMDCLNIGLGAVMYDTKTKEYYTPNTGNVKSEENDKNESKIEEESNLEEKEQKDEQEIDQKGGEKDE